MKNGNKRYPTLNSKNQTKQRKRKAYTYREDSLQGALARYMNMQYPTVLFESDIAGLNLPVTIAKNVYAQRNHRFSFPDFRVFLKQGAYAGLVLELKKEGTIITNKNGTLRKQGEHRLRQYNTIVAFREQGYMAGFCVGFANAKDCIDAYISGDMDKALSYLQLPPL